MVQNPSFYSVIIGTELLNGRRTDKHFDFLNSELIKRGWEQKANFVIKDEPKFIEEVFRFIKNDNNAVMFSFGGIGATPDDYTREAAGNVFRDNGLVCHKEALQIILNKFGDGAYPHRVKMADLPKDAGLLENVITKVPGFYLDERYFFVPGFPEMAKPMIVEALNKFYPKREAKFDCSFVAKTSENDLIEIMQALPKDLELSCLPKLINDKRTAEIYLADDNEEKLKKWCNFFKTQMKQRRITWI